MRHRKKTAKFGRKKSPRLALLNGLAASVILYEKIKTTEAKAKAVRPLVERIITKGKIKSLHSKREIGRVLPDKKATEKVLEVLGPRYQERNGGYTRIVKLARRQGDNAPIVQIEFV